MVFCIAVLLHALKCSITMYPSKSHFHFNFAGMVIIFLDRIGYLYFKLYLKRLLKSFFY